MELYHHPSCFHDVTPFTAAFAAPPGVPHCIKQRVPTRRQKIISPMIRSPPLSTTPITKMRKRSTSRPRAETRPSSTFSITGGKFRTIEFRSGWGPLHAKRWDPYYDGDDDDGYAVEDADVDDDEPFLITLVDRIADILSIPTPGVQGDPLALGYPLFLAFTFIILPFPTSALLTVFFVGFCSLGRWLVPRDDYEEDDYDYYYDDPSSSLLSTDLVALGGAVVSSALLAPSSSEATLAATGFMSNILVLIPLTTILAVVLVSKGFDDFDKLFALIAVLVSKSMDGFGQGTTIHGKPSPDNRLLEMWDDEFRTDQEFSRKDKRKK